RRDGAPPPPAVATQAAEHNQAAADADFTALHELRREHRVEIIMAGDTHDLALYVERSQADGAEHVMHHVVNGGCGAYHSSGTALAWPASPAVPQWAFHPSTAALIAKIDLNTPRWKWPSGCGRSASARGHSLSSGSRRPSTTTWR